MRILEPPLTVPQKVPRNTADGRVSFLARNTPQDLDEEIADRIDEAVTLCTEDYTTDDDIEKYSGSDSCLAVTCDETYVIGDVHANSCENRHSFLRK